jgi:chaperone BCS1
MKVQIGHATRHQLEQMFQRFYPKLSLAKSHHFAEVVQKKGKDVTIAQIQGYFMFYKSDPDAALNNIDKIWA